MLVCEVCNSLNISNIESWVTWSFDMNKLCIRTNSRLYSINVCCINNSSFNIKLIVEKLI